MTFIRVLLSIIISQFLLGCYFTPHVWRAEEHLKAKGRDVTENKKEDTARIYYSSKHYASCVSYSYHSHEKTEQRNILLPLHVGRPVAYYDSLLEAEKDFRVIRKFGEYRRFKRLSPKAGPYEDQDWFQDILTIGYFVPITSVNDQLIEESPVIEKRFYSEQKSPSDFIYPGIELYHPRALFWQADDGMTPSHSFLNNLIADKLNISSKEELHIQGLAWLDKNGTILKKGTTVLPPLDENHLLINVNGRYYRYKAHFYSMLAKYGAFSPSFQNGDPNIYLINFDKENNQALIGFQLVEDTFSATANNRAKNVDCTTGDWLLLADSANEPYRITIVESDEKRVYHNSLITRTVLTPIAVVGDIVIAPFVFFYMIAVSIWGM